jgi:hypothetical protein
MTHDTPAVLAEGLEKSYGKTRVLAGLDLAVEQLGCYTVAAQRLRLASAQSPGGSLFG